jgi:hypothetical protein
VEDERQEFCQMKGFNKLQSFYDCRPTYHVGDTPGRDGDASRGVEASFGDSSIVRGGGTGDVKPGRKISQRNIHYSLAKAYSVMATSQPVAARAVSAD